MEIAEVLSTVSADGFPYANSIVHLFTGGSSLYGSHVASQSDEDWYGVYVEPPEMLVGLDEYPHHIFSTANQAERNKPGDLDVCLWSLKKWAGLVVGGNPTALTYLYAPNVLSYKKWEIIQNNKSIFLAKSHARSFRGFAKNQLDRLDGTKGQGKHGQRPKLEEQYGFDTKAGSYVIRLLHEGIELMQTGQLVYPRPEHELLTSIRLGNYELDKIKIMAAGLFVYLDEVAQKSSLPDTVNEPLVSDLIASVYTQVWNDDNEVIQMLSKAFNVAAFWISQECQLHPALDAHKWEDEAKVKDDILNLVFELREQEKAKVL